MPIENERKYVLSMSPHLEKEIRNKAEEVLQLRQGYLLRGKDINVRIRRSENHKVKYYMTVKVEVSGECVEIEKCIDESDYAKLSLVAEAWLDKIRYVVEGWEIDFFKAGDETYFVMAEIELPEKVEAPEKIPKWISPYVIYTVPKGDSRFSSKKLSDVTYAHDLLNEVVGYHPPRTSKPVPKPSAQIHHSTGRDSSRKDKTVVASGD